jgi:hypothetical protein
MKATVRSSQEKMEAKTDTTMGINQEVMKTIQEKVEASQQKMDAVQGKMEVKSGQEEVKATMSTSQEKNGDCNKFHSVQTGRDDQKTGGRYPVMCQPKDTLPLQGTEPSIEGTQLWLLESLNMQT